jgi:hypothetical protein
LKDRLIKHKKTMKTSAALTSLLTLLSIQSAVGAGNAIDVPLGGGQQVPPITSTVTGQATIELLSDGTIEYFVSLLNPNGVELLGAAGAHIHCGESGANGPVVVPLAQQVDGGRLTSPLELSGTIDEAGIVENTCGATIALLYESIRAGRTYINVHSTENPTGEVRGQIPKVTAGDGAINVPLRGENQVPAVDSTVTGMITIQLFSDNSLEFFADLANPNGVALLGESGAHIHCGDIDATGPVVAFLAQPVDGGRTEAQVGFSGSVVATGIADDACGATLDLLYQSIIAGRTYVNVHSTENPSGEVRGQILLPALAPTSAPTRRIVRAPISSPAALLSDLLLRWPQLLPCKAC